jgi:hypothetical protein
MCAHPSSNPEERHDHGNRRFRSRRPEAVAAFAGPPPRRPVHRGRAGLPRASLSPKATVDKLWPLFLLVPVAILGQQYLEKGKAAAGVLVPLGILSYLAVFFLWLNFTSWDQTAVTWPHFLLAPAFGLFLHFLATRKTGLLVPITALCVIAVVFLAGFHRSTVAIAVALIAVGVVLLVGPVFRGRKG